MRAEVAVEFGHPHDPGVSQPNARSPWAEKPGGSGYGDGYSDEAFLGWRLPPTIFSQVPSGR